MIDLLGEAKQSGEIDDSQAERNPNNTKFTYSFKYFPQIGHHKITEIENYQCYSHNNPYYLP